MGGRCDKVCSDQKAFADLGTAFSNYFRRKKEGSLPKQKLGQKPRKDRKPLGHPRFKSKKRSKKSFYLSNDQFKVDGHWVRVPKLGWAFRKSCASMARSCQQG